MRPITTAELLQQGLTKQDIRARQRRGDLVRLTRGLWTTRELRPEDRHVALASARSHALALESAALLHGLPVYTLPARVVTVRAGGGRSRRHGEEWAMSGPLPDHHLTTIDGALVTTRARTVVDLARVRGLLAGLIPWDAARWTAREDHALMIFDDATDEVIETLAGRRGIGRARQARTLSSALSQSPAETRSLAAIRQLGLPEPVQQFAVVGPGGRSVGFSDFAWPDEGVLGEYDGLGKYTELSRPGETPADVMRREKRRQEAMEALGWVFARWGKEEMAQPHLLRQRIQGAFAIARNRQARHANAS